MGNEHRTVAEVFKARLVYGQFKLVFGCRFGCVDFMKENSMIVYTVDGVGGVGLMPLTMNAVVKLADAEFDVRHFVWSHGFGRIVADIRDRKHMYDKGELLANVILESNRAGRKVAIVAKSGGTGVALNALERLPADTVETVVLLAPAVSPGYDLSPALNAVRSQMYSFNSNFDLFWLAFCTSLVCTADGVKAVAAGCVGFHNPERYDKLEQISWNAPMMKQLHFGTHTGTSMYPFLSEYVLPLLNKHQQLATL